MKFNELTIYTNTFGSELVADILYSNGSEGVYIYDSNDLYDMIKSDIVWDYVDDELLVKNEVVRVSACFEREGFEKTHQAIFFDIEKLRENATENVGSLEFSVREIDDEDWINVWKKFYQPIVTKSVVIVPEWINFDAGDGQTIVKMNPGMAFGTGEHESTRMCLELLGEVGVDGKVVFDIGAGSGILGISALMLGASKCRMSDIDDIALRSARENCLLNGIGERAVVENVSALKGVTNEADLVFANITADVLTMISTDVKEYLKVGGKVILSGIIKVRYDEVLSAYQNIGFKLVKEMRKGEWVALLFEK